MFSEVYIDGILQVRGTDYEECMGGKLINHTLVKFGWIEPWQMKAWIKFRRDPGRSADIRIVKHPESDDSA